MMPFEGSGPGSQFLQGLELACAFGRLTSRGPDKQIDDHDKRVSWNSDKNSEVSRKLGLHSYRSEDPPIYTLKFLNYKTN